MLFLSLPWNLNCTLIGGVFLLGVVTGAALAAWLGLRCQLQVTFPNRATLRIAHAKTMLKIAEARVEQAVRQAEAEMHQASTRVET